MPKPSSKPSLVRPRAPPTPALLISTCSGSPRSRNSAAHRRTDARSARSSGRNTTASFPVAAVISAAVARPLSAERQATKTLPPRLARSPAVARPIPVLAPVTRKVRPDRSVEFAGMVTLYRTGRYFWRWGAAAGAGLCLPRYARRIAGGSGHGPAFPGGPVRIAGEEQQHEPGATGTAADASGLGADAAARRSARRRRTWIILGVAAVLLISLNTYVAYELARSDNANAGANLRPSGIPGNISTGLANLMQLSPVPGVRAPGFTLTDQNGHTMSLASLRGKVVVLEFMDPHCTDICPIVSQEFVYANRELGPLAGKVVFAAVNVNQYFNSPQAMQSYSKAHQLGSIASWHFFTGSVPAMRKVWRDYHIQVEAPSRNAAVAHTSAIYFIKGSGTERYVTSPMVDHTSDGTSY